MEKQRNIGNTSNRSMARFSDINRADELKAAAIKLAAWRALDSAAKKAAYKAAAAVGNGKRANRSSKIGFIRPFGAADKLWYETRVLAPQAETGAPKTNEEAVGNLVAAVLEAIGDGIVAELPAGAGNTSVAVKKVQFAKVRLTEKTSTVPDPVISRMTGRSYTKHVSNTISCPYGKSANFTSEAVARGLIRTALLGTSPAGKTVGFSPQGDVKIGVKTA